MKQVIKSRILADCWKKHATYGTIPIEIHVMAALSASEYVLPEPRPWDPMRFDYWAEQETGGGGAGVCAGEGEGVGKRRKGVPGPLSAVVPAMGSATTMMERRTSAESPMPGSPASIVSSTTNTVSTIESTSGHTNDRSSISSIPSTISEEASHSSFHIPKLSISSERPLSPDAISTVGSTSVPPTPTTASANSRPHLSSSLHSKLIPNDASGFGPSWHWRAGAIHRGHPSIIPLLEFFEDAHFYYLILPAANPSFPPSPHFPPVSLPAAHPSHAAVATNGNGSGSLLGNGNGNGGKKEKKFPSDLFDLVERYPYGLPTALVRTYLGQIADGLAFLHARGICHRDIKDENVVLADDGRCWLIDFGSSGVVRKEGWDTFSGT